MLGLHLTSSGEHDQHCPVPLQVPVGHAAPLGWLPIEQTFPVQDDTKHGLVTAGHWLVCAHCTQAGACGSQNGVGLAHAVPPSY
jgi:hypothetical protein